MRAETLVGLTVRVVVLAGVTASVLAAAGAPAEAQAPSPDGLCDAAGVEQFDDVGDGAYGSDHILCMRALGLSVGLADGAYGPERELTRAQMASFIVRLWRDVLGRACPEVDTPFTDVDPDIVHAADIDCLYGLRITTGTTATTYDPQAKLTSWQISLFLMRTYRRAVDTCGTVNPGLEEAVDYLEGLRVIPSVAEGRSQAVVTRAQMAVYVIGLWHNVSGRGLPPAPPALLTAPAPDALPAVAFSLRDFVNGRWLEQQDARLASSIKQLEWARDGVDKVESAVIQDLLYTAVEDLRVASRIVSLGWLTDGIDPTEAEAVSDLRLLAQNAADAAEQALALRWVTDGIDSAEAEALDSLAWISRRDAAAAARIADMPFATTIESPDVTALRSLLTLAVFWPESFERVLAHPTLSAGLSDDMSPVVGTLHGAGGDPGLIDRLLDPDTVSIERRILRLPLAGEVVADIIRTGPGAARSMDLLAHSLRCAEEIMAVPLPTGHVALLFEDAATGSFAGVNFGTHMAAQARLDTDADRQGAEVAAAVIAHEVAHYYWRDNSAWIDEGAARLVEAISRRARTGQPVGATDHPCAHARAIAELESLGEQQAALAFVCSYSLGERLFVDLYRTLGDGPFHAGLRSLYLRSRVAAGPARGQETTLLSIDHLREAFLASGDAAATVIARWYDGTEPYDLSGLDHGPVDPRLPGISGRIDEAAIVVGAEGPAVSGFSARAVEDSDDWVYLKLKYSYGVDAVAEVPMRIVEYFEDGLRFAERAVVLTAEPRSVGGWWRLSVGAAPSEAWAPGRYWVHVYADDRKVAAVEYEVTP
jgi:hypothetical protein